MNDRQVVSSTQIDSLPIEVFANARALGRAAAHDAAGIIQQAFKERGQVNVVMATGNSMLTYMEALRSIEDIPWHAVRLFLIDQYLGVDEDRLGTLAFIRKHLLAYVEPMEFHPVTSSLEDVEASGDAFEALLREHPSDLTSLGIGENGHLAFNDPHNASFSEAAWMKKVELSPESRQQPVSEGRFESLDDVPTHALTMTIPALLAAREILCIVPERRKASSVKRCLEEPVDESLPASVLRTVDNARLYLDVDSAALLSSNQDWVKHRPEVPR